MGNETTGNRPPGPPGWRHGRALGGALLIGYAAAVAVPVGLALALGPTGGTLYEIGRAAGIAGFMLVLLQVVLAGRFKALDRPFGLDTVMRFHKTMALVAVVLLLAHPLLLLAAMGSGWLLGFDVPWPINLGKVTLVVALAVVLTAVFFKALRIPYQHWRVMHKGAIAVGVLGFLHSYLWGADLQMLPGMRVLWIALIALAGGLFVYRNTVLRLWGRRRFRVVEVAPESHDTFTVTVEPADGRPLPHYPGQFMFLTLKRPGRRSEEHPFTISSAPTREWPLTATIKQSGDFTNTISQTRPGDSARIEAPYGRFSYVFHQPRAFLFIVGGVGITPIMSMLRTLRDSGDQRPIRIIFGSKTSDDILFRDELDNLPEHAQVTHILSHPGADWTGPTGLVTPDVIRHACRDVLDEADVYLCGPPPMMAAVRPMLRALGLPNHRIHWERFAL